MSPPEPGAGLSPRRKLLVEAALHVVADHGLRGLTHRAVDRQAGLPEGSCSAYLRTRRALVGALAEYVAAALRDDLERLRTELETCELGDDRAVDVVTTFFMRWLDEGELLLVRMELALEASRDPELASGIMAGRGHLIGLVDSILSARGKDHASARAETLVASFDGVLFAALGRPAGSRRAFVRQSIEVLMGGLG